MAFKSSDGYDERDSFSEVELDESYFDGYAGEPEGKFSQVRAFLSKSKIFVALGLSILFSGVIILGLVLALFSNPDSVDSVKGDSSVINNSETAFDRLPSLNSLIGDVDAYSIIYTKDYQLSMYQRQKDFTVDELEAEVASFEGMQVVSPVLRDKSDKNKQFVSFENDDLILTYNLAEGLVGISYKNKSSLDDVAQYVFDAESASVLNDLGFISIVSRDITGWHTLVRNTSYVISSEEK